MATSAMMLVRGEREEARTLAVDSERFNSFAVVIVLSTSLDAALLRARPDHSLPQVLRRYATFPLQ
ncbi:MAG: hypothetical protein ACK2UO_12070 [Caldilineaceae bacterium]